MAKLYTSFALEAVAIRLPSRKRGDHEHLFCYFGCKGFLHDFTFRLLKNVMQKPVININLINVYMSPKPMSRSWGFFNPFYQMSSLSILFIHSTHPSCCFLDFFTSGILWQKITENKGSAMWNHQLGQLVQHLWSSKPYTLLMCLLPSCHFCALC